jgi:hypothetical protein
MYVMRTLIYQLSVAQYGGLVQLSVEQMIQDDKEYARNSGS